MTRGQGFAAALAVASAIACGMAEATAARAADAPHTPAFDYGTIGTVVRRDRQFPIRSREGTRQAMKEAADAGQFFAAPFWSTVGNAVSDGQPKAAPGHAAVANDPPDTRYSLVVHVHHRDYKVPVDQARYESTAIGDTLRVVKHVSDKPDGMAWHDPKTTVTIAP